MREIENIAADLFDKIRSRFDTVRLGDENAKSTQDPDEARFFNFDYVSADGTKFGNVTISLIDEDSLKVYYSKDITDALDQMQTAEWFNFLKSLRQFAKRNMLTFDTRDITRSNLQLKDVRQQSKAGGTLSVDDMDNVTESKLWGTSRSSYQDFGPAKIIVRHSDNVDEERRGARSRNIEAIFIENTVGERRLLPFKNLHGARAMARHISCGGEVDDDLGSHISECCQEMASLRHFVVSTKHRQFEDADTSEMASAAVGRYMDLKKNLQRMASGRGYHTYKEAYIPEAGIEEEYDLNELRERFVRKIYDDRFNDALPYVYRAYQKKQQALETDLGEEFETWAESVVEGTWATPEAESDIEQLDKLMASPIEVGEDGTNASGVLYDILGDDQLYDKFSELAEQEGPDADVRPLIIDWLNSNGYPELAAKYQTNAEPETDDGVHADQPNQTVGGTGMDSNQSMSMPSYNSPTGMQESHHLASLKRLAGLLK
jgi:hypothetical protein